MCKLARITSARIVKVIEVKAKKGIGTEYDPVREITQYWDQDGKLLAEKDPYLHMVNDQRGDANE